MLPEFARSLRRCFIRADQESQIVFQEKSCLLQHGGNRGVGRQPHHKIRGDITDMVAAPGHARPIVTVITGRPQAQGHTRRSSQALQLAYQHHRPEDTAMLVKARRKVGDFDAAAVLVIQAGDQHGGIVQILLFRVGEVHQVDGEKSEITIIMALAQQRTKERVAIETWQACPGHLGAFIDQDAQCAIANQRKIKTAHEQYLLLQNSRPAKPARQPHRAIASARGLALADLDRMPA